MFSRFSALLPVVTLAAVSSVAGSVIEARQTTSTCTSGSNYCCSSVQSPTSDPVSTLAGLLGINVGSLTAPVGLTCTSVLGSASCNEQQACCTGNNYDGGLLVLACDPINVNVL